MAHRRLRTNSRTKSSHSRSRSRPRKRINAITDSVTTPNKHCRRAARRRSTRSSLNSTSITTSTLSNVTTTHRQPNNANISGLQNLGSTCYFNADVQALYSIPLFRESYIEYSHLFRPEQFSSKLATLFSNMKRQRVASPDDVVSHFESLNPDINWRNQQQDAHSLLDHHILSVLKEEYLSIAEGVAFGISFNWSVLVSKLGFVLKSDNIHPNVQLRTSFYSQFPQNKYIMEDQESIID
eukprot:522066_1